MTYSQIQAFIRIMVSIIDSDGTVVLETKLKPKFVHRFKMSHEQIMNLYYIKPGEETEADYENLKKLDDTTKQELSNILFEVMAADGKVSDPESVMFMILMNDSGFPVPDTQAWHDWLASSEQTESNETLVIYGQQLAAAMKAAGYITVADGRHHENEVAEMNKLFTVLNTPQSRISHILEVAQVMTNEAMSEALQSLNSYSKKFISGFLIAVGISDRYVDDSENSVIQAIKDACGFQNIDPEEAYKCWKSHQ
jgi:uncharacterized tellurite resistance protein B-like protein